MINTGDATLDHGRPEAVDHGSRVLSNGARLYNDHGHPEYATPECWSSRELALHDLAGERIVLRAAQTLQAKLGRRVRVFKNNTDFHGASYGTHESYLVPRSLGFERLYRAVTPMLVARVPLCGAGKVGAETGRPCAFQMSQRADFFSEAASVDTLYRRPVFNTRDEPHADPARWIRLHVICGDANRIPAATRRKVDLVKLALHLEEQGVCPRWDVDDPVRAFQHLSRCDARTLEIPLGRSRGTCAEEVLESYFAAAERELDLDEDLRQTVDECRRLLHRPPDFAEHVDWAAKRGLLERIADPGQWSREPATYAAYDLAYHDLDPEEDLYAALAGAGLAHSLPEVEVVERMDRCVERTRAFARGEAVRRFVGDGDTVCWQWIVLDGKRFGLDPDREYPSELASAGSVVEFVQQLETTR